MPTIGSVFLFFPETSIAFICLGGPPVSYWHPLHRLNRSRLNLSPLLTLLTTPNLKNFSSPCAVLPPMYILSAPKTSLKPSELESLPLRRDCCGIGIPRGECNLAAAAAAACAAVDEVAPADVEWPREVPGAEDGVDTEYDVAAAVAAPADEDVVGWDLLADEESEGGAGCCRKAAKKPERKKGRWGAIAGLVFWVRDLAGGIPRGRLPGWRRWSRSREGGCADGWRRVVVLLGWWCGTGRPRVLDGRFG